MILGGFRLSKNTEMLGVKVKSETKERISDLIEKAKAAGMIEFNGDIFDLFLERFHHDELSTKMEYGADLKELNQITRRINEIFINLAERNETNLDDLKKEHEKTTNRLNVELLDLKQKSKEYEELLTEKDNIIKGLTEDGLVNQKRMQEIEAVQNSYTERIEELKSIIGQKEEKIADKNEMISQKEEAISSMKEDIDQNDKLKNDIKLLSSKIETLQQTIASKDGDLKKQREELEFECQKRVFSLEQELNKEKAKEIKSIQDQLTEQTNHSREKYEKVLSEKDRLLSVNYELKVTVDRMRNDNEKNETEIASKEKEIVELKNIVKQLESKAKKK